MIEDYFKLAIDGIRHRQLRSWLTMVGIFIGIIAVVALISLGDGLQKVVDEQFENVGGDRIMVTPGGGGLLMSAGGSFTTAKLQEDDLQTIERAKGVDNAIGYVIATGDVTLDSKRKTSSIFGAPTDAESLRLMKQIDFFVVDGGRYLKDGDTYKAQIGPRTGELFDKELKVGDRIEIEGVLFDIVGENKKTGNPYHDSKITIPIETAWELFNKTSEEYSAIIVKAEKGSDMDEVAENIKDRLRKHRDVKEDEEDFSVQTAENIVQTFKDILSLVTGFLAAIAGISLLVGGVGIMTTMYTSVLERTDQIGIMKAVGARNSIILQMFVIEAGLLGIVGGIIGVILGLAVSKLFEYVVVHYYGLDIFRIYAGPELIVGAIAFSFIVGCLSGILPAYRASKMHPVEALRQ